MVSSNSHQWSRTAWAARMAYSLTEISRHWAAPCLRIRHGAKIPELCRKLQSNVKEAVQNMTGVVVAKWPQEKMV